MYATSLSHLIPLSLSKPTGLALGSQDSSVTTVTKLGAGKLRSEGSIPGRDKIPLYSIQTVFGTKPVSYQVVTGGLSLPVK
jgi:hypothetical protein